MTSKIDQLKQLGELKDQGVLTETEFKDQEIRILSSSSCELLSDFDPILEPLGMQWTGLSEKASL
ncbi:hypothetical protein [Streptomyces sp. NPDC050988]|uniref:hypothetical protein n=1 Tax=Streptomyces sp. NPDC050988 TaxID=3365637 RepID=UPI0037A2C640